MKQIVTLLMAVLVMACTNKTTAPSADIPTRSNAVSNAGAEEMLRSFYTEYIMQGDVPPTDNARMAVIKKYCTAELVQEIEEASLDSDPFLSAQDSDPATVKTLIIQQDDKDKNIYAVCYTWPSTNQIICTDVTVAAVGNVFKISYVELTGY